MNCTLFGRLTRDVELKVTNSGMNIANFSVAENFRKKQGGEYVDAVSFFDVVFFGARAEVVAKYFQKGSFIVVEGDMQQDSYEKDGKKIVCWKIVGNNFRFVSNDKARSNGSEPTKMGDDDVPF